jgi:ABC-type sugar transport system permease subunit
VHVLSVARDAQGARPPRPGTRATTAAARFFAGGPGTASETINLYLYLQAFAFYNIGNASAVVVVFFVIVLALALVLLHVREKTKWT